MFSHLLLKFSGLALHLLSQPCGIEVELVFVVPDKAHGKAMDRMLIAREFHRDLTGRTSRINSTVDPNSRLALFFSIFHEFR